MHHFIGRPLCICIGVCLLQTAPLAEAGQSDTAWHGVAKRFEARLAAERVVGGALVFTSAKERRSAYFGVQDLETAVPVGESTIFHWASITKTFTAIAAQQLIDAGKLSLQTPAVTYLPELRAMHSPVAPLEELRVEHLMAHTAGLRGPTWPWGGDKPWHPHEPTHWSQLVAMMPYTEVEFRPGERFSYSNPGYTFLGRIVEVLTGEDIEVHVDKNVLRPLQMHASYFDRTPAHLLERRANNYYLRDGQPAPNGVDFDTGVTNGNGGLNASIADMIRYVEYLSGKTAHAKFPLPRAALEKMWRPRASVGAEPALTESMGLGFFIVSFDPDGEGATPARRFIGHTGTQMGFRSFIYVDPETSSAVLMAVNTRATENYRGLYKETRRDVFENLFAPQPPQPTDAHQKGLRRPAGR